ncbi:MAG: complex I subunit 5 family protein [Lachnospiraceae bacterium]|nr:complex I subunit 5 family protein [Lachnospiraceae bacterium]
MNENMLISLIFSPFVMGIVAFAVGKKHHTVRDYLTIGYMLCMLTGMLYLAYNIVSSGETLYVEIPEICGFGLFFEMDGFRAIYASIAVLMWTMTALFCKEYFCHHKHTSRFYLFYLFTLGATLGVFLSGDLMTTFVFFEIMSFTSYVWVAQEENRASLRAAETYLAVAVIGGLVMLMGIFMLYARIGSLRIDDLILVGMSDRYTMIAGGCMLFGFCAKAGAFPLHIWLPKAHPVAPAPASALLSGILTKTGIYGTLILSCRLFHNNAQWGMLILCLGVITMFGGALLAVFSIDVKRILACSSMSQIGFILIGIGMQDLLQEENQLALHGTMLHMMNHSLIKLVLFMVAGVIYMNLHALDLNVVRGYGCKKKVLMVSFLIGALAIMGIPMFGGYISKTLLHESIVEYGGGMLFHVIEWVFLVSGGMTIAYMTKLFVAIFIEKNNDRELQHNYDLKSKYMSKGSMTAICASSLILFVIGLFPNRIMEKLAISGEFFLGAEYEQHRVVDFFSLENLKGAAISITIGAILYLFVVRKLLIKDGEYVNRWPKRLDLEDLLYRPILLRFLPFVFGVICRCIDCLLDTIVVAFRKTLFKDSPLPYERTEGTAFTELLGHICNGWQIIMNKTFHKKSPQKKDYVHLMAMKHFAAKENHSIIQRSLSFGLLLFCVGITITLIYIVLM